MRINLFYWSAIRFANRKQENYGDLLSKYIVERVSNRRVFFYNIPKKKTSWFKKDHLLAIGSIINYGNDRSHIWGSGIIVKNSEINAKEIHAVRGPKTRERALELNLNCPEIYGDPALLLSKYFNPNIEKTHDLGIIPHYVDYTEVKEWYKDEPHIKVIDLMTNDIEATTTEILSCKTTISSSLHGIILSHAYLIPSIWVKFSEKLYGDDIKFEDYFLSVELDPYSPDLYEEKLSEKRIINLFEAFNNVPKEDKIKSIQDNLLNSFPYNS